MSCEGLVFAISGKLSRGRNELKSAIEEAGGVVKSSVTKDVTHLLSEGGKDSAKMASARAKGIEVVDEAWLEDKIGAPPEPPAKKAKKITKKKEVEEDAHEEEQEEEEEGAEDGDDEGGPFAGFVFAITGKLSKGRAEIKAAIEGGGGVVKSSVTKDVTHLLANTESGKETAKITAARDKGIEVVDEAWLEEKLAA